MAAVVATVKPYLPKKVKKAPDSLEIATRHFVKTKARGKKMYDGLEGFSKLTPVEDWFK